MKTINDFFGNQRDQINFLERNEKKFFFELEYLVITYDDLPKFINQQKRLTNQLQIGQFDDEIREVLFKNGFIQDFSIYQRNSTQIFKM